MRINKIVIVLSFIPVLTLPLACQQSCNDISQKTGGDHYTVPQAANKIDTHLYEFVFSRLYTLSSDTLPAHNVIIEFAMRGEDTLFEISILSEIYKDLLKDVEVGCVTTDNFTLFVLDNDSIGDKYYQIDSIWSKRLPYETTHLVLSIEGMVKNGKFYEKHPSMDYSECCFVLDHPRPIR